MIALSLLVYLLPDSRSKPDADKVVFFTHVSFHMVFINNLRNRTYRLRLISTKYVQRGSPYALVVGSHKDVPIYLMAANYILNICYPPGCQNLYCFLEVVLLKLEEPHITITTSVKNLLARLRLD